MKKPQYKDKPETSVCQVFYRQYMLSLSGIVAKNCFRTQNFIQYRQKLLILTVKTAKSIEKDVLYATCIRSGWHADRHLY